MAYTTRLGGNNASFDAMMKQGFGIVTVMNAKVYEAPELHTFKSLTAYGIYNTYKNVTPLCTIDTLKIANVTEEGPTKTISGGQYSNPLIKFGKSARLEMQDALGRSSAIDALCGGIQEFDGNAVTGLHFGEDFQGPKMIIGESFFIDRKTGQQVSVIIMFYQFLPDSIFNLTQDAEGDATVFDMNGDLLTTEILVGRRDGEEKPHGVFYSIIDPKESTESDGLLTIEKDTDGTTLKLTAKTGFSVVPTTIAKDTAARVVVTDGEQVVVFDEVIKNY